MTKSLSTLNADGGLVDLCQWNAIPIVAFLPSATYQLSICARAGGVRFAVFRAIDVRHPSSKV